MAEERFPFAQADFRVALTNVRGANPDAVVAINANEGLGMPALIRQARQMRIRGELVTAVGTIAPSVIAVAGEPANGIIGADIYFPDVEPFASNPATKPSCAGAGYFSAPPPKVHGPPAHRSAGLGDGGERGNSLEREAVDGASAAAPFATRIARRCSGRTASSVRARAVHGADQKIVSGGDRRRPPVLRSRSSACANGALGRSTT